MPFRFFYADFTYKRIGYGIVQADRCRLLTRFRLFGPILMTNRLWALTNKRHSPVKSPVSTNQGKLVVLWNKTPLQGFPEAFTGLPLATDWI